MRILLILTACFLFCPLVVRAQSPSSKEISLADWGLKSPFEVGYVSIGILHKKGGDEMVLYDIRKEKPKLIEPAGERGKVPAFKGPFFLVGHFDRGNVNRLNGYYNTFFRLPSTASLGIGATPDGSSALSFSYQNKSPGFSGFWIQLFNFRIPSSERVFLDSTPFKYVGFRICGSKGGEPVVLQVADRKWEKKEDSLPVGDVASFLPNGKITAEWQVAWVPLEKFPAGIDRGELASFVFRIPSDHSGQIFLKDLVFAKEKGDIPSSGQKAVSQAPLQNAMWLWETEKILKSEEEQKRLIEFCKRQRITDLFVQVPYESKLELPLSAWIIQWTHTPFRSLNKQLHQAGIRAHALDGDSRFALREWHGRVLALIERIIQYNKEVSPQERFSGVRYDNEPYLLPSFSGVQKESVLRQYLELLDKAGLLARTAGLKFGVDIPFWFDSKNEFFEPTAEVEGRPMSELIIDRVDNIGIMDYRTVAYGADGVIAHGEGELAYAAQRGKKVFIGLETEELPNETLLEFEKGMEGQSKVSVEDLGGGGKARLNLSSGGGKGSATLFQTRSVKVPSSKITFSGKTERDLKDVMDGAEREFSWRSSFLGFAIHSYESYRPWLERQGGK